MILLGCVPIKLCCIQTSAEYTISIFKLTPNAGIMYEIQHIYCLLAYAYAYALVKTNLNSFRNTPGHNSLNDQHAVVLLILFPFR